MQAELDHLLRNYPVEERIQRDPVGIVRKYRTPQDQEVAALIAALLAFGNVTSIRQSVSRALERLGPEPGVGLCAMDRKIITHRFRGFVHRIYRGHDVARLLTQAQRIIGEYGSLGAALEHHFQSTGDMREALGRWSDTLRGTTQSRGLRHLVSDPRAGSACKRTLLLLRWMVRPNDGVDLGLWSLPTSALIIPLDTHIHRIARNLGLTNRNDASWRTAEEITNALRSFDPNDPVKYDFALCHYGISRQCPSVRKMDICGRCVLRPACIHWKNNSTALNKEMPRTSLEVR